MYALCDPFNSFIPVRRVCVPVVYQVPVFVPVRMVWDYPCTPVQMVRVEPRQITQRVCPVQRQTTCPDCDEARRVIESRVCGKVCPCKPISVARCDKVCSPCQPTNCCPAPVQKCCSPSVSKSKETSLEDYLKNLPQSITRDIALMLLEMMDDETVCKQSDNVSDCETESESEDSTDDDMPDLVSNDVCMNDTCCETGSGLTGPTGATRSSESDKGSVSGTLTVSVNGKETTYDLTDPSFSSSKVLSELSSSVWPELTKIMDPQTLQNIGKQLGCPVSLFEEKTLQEALKSGNSLLKSYEEAIQSCKETTSSLLKDESLVSLGESVVQTLQNSAGKLENSDPVYAQSLRKLADQFTSFMKEEIAVPEPTPKVEKTIDFAEEIKKIFPESAQAWKQGTDVYSSILKSTFPIKPQTSDDGKTTLVDLTPLGTDLLAAIGIKPTEIQSFTSLLDTIMAPSKPTKTEVKSSDKNLDKVLSDTWEESVKESEELLKEVNKQEEQTLPETDQN